MRRHCEETSTKGENPALHIKRGRSPEGAHAHVAIRSDWGRPEGGQEGDGEVERRVRRTDCMVGQTKQRFKQ